MRTIYKTAVCIGALFVLISQTFPISKIGFLDPYWIVRHLRYHRYVGSPPDTLTCWSILNTRSGYFPLIGDTLGLDMCWSLCDPWAVQLLSGLDLKLASEWYPDSTWKYVAAQQQVCQAGEGGYFEAPLPTVGEFAADSDTSETRFVVRSVHGSHTAGDIIPETHMGYGWLGGYRMYNFRELPPYDGTDTLYLKIVFKWDSVTVNSPIAQVILSPIDTFEITRSNAQACRGIYDSLIVPIDHRWNTTGFSLRMYWPGFHDLYVDRLEIYDRAFRHLFYDDDWQTKLNTVTASLIQYHEFAGSAHYNFRIDEPNPRTYKGFKRVYDAYHSGSREISVMLNPNVLDSGFFDFVVPDTLLFFNYTLGGDSFQSRRPMPPIGEPLNSWYTSNSSDVAYVDSFLNPYGCNYWSHIHSLQHDWDRLIGSANHGEEYEWGLYKMHEVAAGTVTRPWQVFLAAGQVVSPMNRTVVKVSLRDPTPNEMHCMVWLALSFKPNGIGWFRVAGHMWGDSIKGDAQPPCCDTDRVERTRGLLDWTFDDGTDADGPEDYPNGAAFRPTERFYAAQSIHAMLDTVGPALEGLQWTESNATRAFEANNTIPVHFPSGAYIYHLLCEKDSGGSSWVSEPPESTYVQYAGFVDLSHPQDYWLMTINRRCLSIEKRRVHFRLYDIPDTNYVIHYLLADSVSSHPAGTHDEYIETRLDLAPGRGELIRIKVASPRIMVEPRTLDFGDVHADSTDYLTITVSNAGDWELLIASMELTLGQVFELVPASPWPDTVAAGDSLIYSIRFAPSDTGNFIDTLCITHNAGDTVDITLHGRGVREALSVFPDSLDFSLTRVGSPDTLDLYMINPGTADLLVENIVSSDPAFEVSLPAGLAGLRGRSAGYITRAVRRSTLGKHSAGRSSRSYHGLSGHLDEVSFTVGAGDSQLVYITFVPTEETSHDGVLTIRSSLPDVELPVTGTGAAPHILVDSRAISFGDVHVDSTANLFISVSDTGHWDLLIVGMEFMSGRVFQLVPSPQWPDTVAAMDSLIYTIHCAPLDTGVVEDTLSVIHDAGTPVHVALDVRGIKEALSIYPDSLDFGLTRTESHDTLDFYVINPGTADLPVSDIVSSNPAFMVFLPPGVSNVWKRVSDATKPVIRAPVVGRHTEETLLDDNQILNRYLGEMAFVVVPGDSQVIYVTFAPTEEIDFAGILTIRSTLPDLDLPTQGLGAAAHMVLYPPVLDFGDAYTDSSYNLTLTVSDTGNWDLIITSMELAAGQVFEPVLAPEYPDTVMAHDSLHYLFRFAPEDSGRFVDTLAIFHDAGGPHRVPFAGRGVFSKTDLRPHSLHFGDHWLNTTSRDSFRVVNSGNAPLRIDSIVTRDNGFQIVQTHPFVVEPNDSIFVFLCFTPADTQEYTGVVTVFSGTNNPTVAAAGHGIWTELAADPASVEFGKISLSQTVDTTILLTSLGNTYVSSISASLIIGETFTITQWPVDSIPAYRSAEIEITFVSKVTGVFGDTLVISHPSGEPIQIAFSAEVPNIEDDISTQIPEHYYLHHNYPNPFNPTTTFNFGVPKTSHVSIRIYDVLGRQVDTLVDGLIQPGHQQVIWNCNDCSSGVYLVVMSGEGFNIIRKATLIR